MSWTYSVYDIYDIYIYIVNIYHTTLHPMQRFPIRNSKFQGFATLECALLYMCIGMSAYPQKHQPSLCQSPHKSENFQILAYFLCKNCNPLEKVNSNPPLKTEILPSSPPFWKFSKRLNPPPSRKGVHTLIIPYSSGDTANERIL